MFQVSPTYFALCSCLLFGSVLSVNYGAGQQQNANTYGLTNQYHNQGGYKNTQSAYSGSAQAWEQSMGTHGYNHPLLKNHYNQVKTENYHKQLNLQKTQTYQSGFQAGYSGQYPGNGKYPSYSQVPFKSRSVGSGLGNNFYGSGYSGNRYSGSGYSGYGYSGYGYGSRYPGYGNMYGVHHGIRPVVPVMYGGRPNYLGGLTGGLLGGSTGKLIGSVALGALLFSAIG